MFNLSTYIYVPDFYSQAKKLGLSSSEKTLLAFTDSAIWIREISKVGTVAGIFFTACKLVVHACQDTHVLQHDMCSLEDLERDPTLIILATGFFTGAWTMCNIATRCCFEPYADKMIESAIKQLQSKAATIKPKTSKNSSKHKSIKVTHIKVQSSN